MKIDFSKIDLERFHLNPRTVPDIGDVMLVVSHKAMWDWNSDELHLRSLLCRMDGTVVSAGFPKFFNFSENPAHDEIVLKGLREGMTSFSEKADGSLIIRSVIDGHVHFRTRGCDVIATDMQEEVLRTINDRYPELLDPSWHQENRSFLMEFVSPKNQIVVKYNEPELIALGWIDFSGDELKFSPAGGRGRMRSVKLMSISNDIRELRETVKAFSDQEGVVAWTHTGDGYFHMSKFKSAWYLRLHSLRSQATPRYMKEFCYVNGIRSLAALKDAFFKEGFDWEVVSYIEPMFHEFMDDVAAVDRRIAYADGFLAQGVKLGMSRKDIALMLKHAEETHEQLKGLFPYMIASALGESQKATEIADGLRLDMSPIQLRALKKAGIEKLGSGKVHDDG